MIGGEAHILSRFAHPYNTFHKFIKLHKQHVSYFSYVGRPALYMVYLYITGDIVYFKLSAMSVERYAKKVQLIRFECIFDV